MKKIRVSVVVILMVFAVLLTFQITYHYVGKLYQDKVNVLSGDSVNFSKTTEIYDLIRQHYVGDWEESAMQDGLVKGLLSGLGDPYARYMTAQEYASYQTVSAGSTYGIGVRATFDSWQNKVIIFDVTPDSPAAKAGLQKGDVILQVGSRTAKEMGFYETVAALSGETATAVTLTVERSIAGRQIQMEYSVSRDRVTQRESTLSYLDENTAYIRFFSLGEKAYDELREYLTKLENGGYQNVIFDVREVDGGDENSLTAMLDLILPKGKLLRKIAADGSEITVSSDENHIDLKMVVLQNGGTELYGELFCAVMRDYSAATLVGETTAGKAWSQNEYVLEDGSAVILSDARYLPPYTESFEGKGVEPDVKVEPSEENVYLLTEKTDAQLLAAEKVISEGVL